jgi:hypothetical protein
MIGIAQLMKHFGKSVTPKITMLKELQSDVQY